MEMLSGYSKRFPTSHGPGDWDFTRSGVDIESKAKNWAKVCTAKQCHSARGGTTGQGSCTSRIAEARI